MKGLIMSLDAQTIAAIQNQPTFPFPRAEIAAVLTAAAKLNPDEALARLQAHMVPVLTDASALAAFAKNYRSHLIVPYLLHKDDPVELLLSTSRMHMNWLWPGVLYVPVDIAPGDEDELRRIYTTALGLPSVVLINHTIPHKSNPVMQAMFGPGEGDYLIRRDDAFVIAEGNGHAFVQMVRELMADIDFSQMTVVVVGAGKAGMLAAKATAQAKPDKIILVDRLDKSGPAKEMGADFYYTTDDIPDLGGKKLVVIDATAHFEDGIQRCVAGDFVERYDSPDNVFIDYNMHTPADAYDALLTRTGVGQAYAAITNHIMTQEIIDAAAQAGVALPPVTRRQFEDAVQQSIVLRDRIKHVIRGRT
jgi:hypothetical protein